MLSKYYEILICMSCKAVGLTPAKNHGNSRTADRSERDLQVRSKSITLVTNEWRSMRTAKLKSENGE